MQSITTTTDNGTDTVVPSTYSNNITTADTNDNVRTNRPNVSNADANGNHGNGQDDDDDDDDDDPRWRPRPVTPTGTTATPPSATARGAVVGSSSSTIEIEELPPARPVKQRIGHVPSDASRGSKPKQSNLSLLSSTIAYATLERCLLGVNGGVLCDDAADGAVNYSKQCKAGHVIDILELRRLSSRGVPDEPPELSRGGRVRRGGGGDGEAGRYGRGDGNRSRGSREKYCDDDDCRYGNDNGNGNDNVNRNSNHSATASNRTTTQPPRQNSDNSLDDYSHSNSNSNSTRTSSYTASNNNAQSPGGNPHRSYRPLVWRVLLGYLPPQTELWNDVLARDRKLYQNLVDELFVSTCPSPHEVLDDRQETPRDGDDDGGGGGAGREAPITPGSATPQPSLPTPHSAGSARSTPGLLSARMQQEWIRGEDSIFNSPDGGDGDRDGDGNDANGNGNGNGNKRGKHPPLTRRLSPMCAMNVPRVRSTKLAAATASLPASVADAAGIVPTLAETRAGMPAGGTIANSLLLPEDGESDDDDDEQDEHDVSPTSLEDANDHRGDGQTVRNNVRIDHKNAGNGLDEGVELRPIHSPWHIDSSDEEENGDEDGQCGHDDSNDNDNHNATLPQSPSMDLDEEENMLLLDEIRKDVIRTHPDLRFFLEPKEDLGQKRYAALERILFVWAKLNKGVRYVQGMNEIVGTLYFVLAHDANEDWANEAEADTYFLFNSLMVEMRDVFVPDLDEADTGIHGRISNMISLLSLHDPEVRCHLDNVGIDPSFYSVRWLTTLLSREFLLPDTIRLWDSMFASTHKDNFLRYVSVTMVMVIRDQLLRGDFSTCLRILQAYPPTNLDRLLESSRALWIYESQITLACHKGGIGLGHALRSISPPPAIIMAYGLRGGIAPQIGEQVRQAGERGLAAARGAANGASHTVANAGRSFLGSALGFWRAGSAESREKKDGSNGGSFRRRANTAM